MATRPSGLSGPQIERYLAEQVRRLLDLPADGPEGEALQLIERVQVHGQTVTLQLPPGRSTASMGLSRHRQAAGGGRAGVVR